jgi:hypothetical protein
MIEILRQTSATEMFRYGIGSIRKRKTKRPERDGVPADPSAILEAGAGLAIATAAEAWQRPGRNQFIAVLP